jgi:hypothetical protein
MYVWNNSFIPSCGKYSTWTSIFNWMVYRRLEYLKTIQIVKKFPNFSLQYCRAILNDIYPFKNHFKKRKQCTICRTYRTSYEVLNALYYLRQQSLGALQS